MEPLHPNIAEHSSFYGNDFLRGSGRSMKRTHGVPVKDLNVKLGIFMKPLFEQRFISEKKTVT